MKQNQKGFGLIHILVVLLILLVIFLTVFLFRNKSTGQGENLVPSTTKETTEQKVSENKDKALTNEIPNFENLSIEDLPNFQDVRAVYEYKNNKIVIGFDHVAEYESLTNKLVRINDRNIIKLINAGVVVGDNLYLSIDRKNQTPNDFPTRRKIVKINLESGEIIKSFFDNDQRRYTNLMLASKDNYIWGSSWDGVIRIDTKKNDEVKFHSISDLGTVPDCPSQVFNLENKITVFLNCQEQGKLIYNESTETWEKQPEVKGELASLINKSAKDFGLDLPYYTYISNLVNNKYYLFSDKGIYTLSKGGFPVFLAKLTVNGSYSTDVNYVEGRPKILATANEKFIGLIGRNMCGPSLDYCPPLVSELVDLENMKVIDLLPSDNSFWQLPEETQNKVIDDIGLSKLEETDNALVMKRATDKSHLLRIDLVDKKLTIQSN